MHKNTLCAPWEFVVKQSHIELFFVYLEKNLHLECTNILMSTLFEKICVHLTRISECSTSVHTNAAQSSPALCVIEEDVDHGTLHILQFVPVCPHSHVEKQSNKGIPDIVQGQVKVTVATSLANIEERPGRDKEDTVHLCLLVNALERLAVDNLSSFEVSVANVEPGEQCDCPLLDRDWSG